VSLSAIYHIATFEDWDDAIVAGIYQGGAAARADGYLHFSTAEQIVESASKHWHGREGMLLVIEPDKLGARLKWEPSRGGALFPHVYGDVPLGAVRRATPLRLGPDGRHVFPELR